MQKHISDDFLYRYIPLAEDKWMESINNTQEELPVYSRKFRRKLKRFIKDSARNKLVRRRIRVARQIAAVIAVVLTIAFAGCMSVEAMRTKLFEMIKTIYREYTEYKFSGDEEEKHDYVYIMPQYLPEGYKEVSRNDMDEMVYVYYQNESTGKNGEIEYMEALADGLGVSLDTEGIVISKMKLCGTEVEYFSNKGTQYLYWTDSDTYYRLVGEIEMNELMKMSESIIESESYKKKNK